MWKSTKPIASKARLRRVMASNMSNSVPVEHCCSVMESLTVMPVPLVSSFSSLGGLAEVISCILVMHFDGAKYFKVSASIIPFSWS